MPGRFSKALSTVYCVMCGMEAVKGTVFCPVHQREPPVKRLSTTNPRPKTKANRRRK
jgi:uncharacterized Zn finger protein (UPF0148 family)